MFPHQLIILCTYALEENKQVTTLSFRKGLWRIFSFIQGLNIYVTDGFERQVSTLVNLCVLYHMLYIWVRYFVK
jgi:hypothetical protein